MLSHLHEFLANRSRKETNRKLSRKSYLWLEMLEDRRLLAACPGNGDPYIVGDLQFCGNFSPLTNGNLQADSNGSGGVPILIGLATEDAEPFNPLLEVDGVVEIPTASSGDTMFTLGQAVDPQVATNLKLRHVLTSPTVWSTSNLEKHDFDANLLSGATAGAMPLPVTNNAKAMPITVAGVSSGFATKDIVFYNPEGPDSATTDAQTWLRGSVSFDSIGFKAAFGRCGRFKSCFD